MWTDAHCHVSDAPPVGADEGPWVPEVALADARSAGVGRFVVVGTDRARSRDAVAVAGRHVGVWATAGVHPHEARNGIDGLAELLGVPRVVGVGECGLDYHYDHSPRAVQREVFAAQIRLAHAHDLTLVVHSRSAWDDTFAVLDAEGVPERTQLHCFTGGPDEARRALDLGCVISFSGIVTFKTADDVRAAARLCPLDRLVVETDAPFLAPVPYRGRPNQPAWVAVVGAAVAEVKGLAPGVVEDATTANAAALFRLDPA